MYKVYNSDTFKEVFYLLIININEVLASNLSDKTIGNKIRKLRVNLGLTQLQFAKFINRGFVTVTKWEQNMTTSKPYALSKIISIYNLPNSYFDI
ncbi:DNA-binding transcriptional regulator, partial [uncultured Clostridium sp.]